MKDEQVAAMSLRSNRHLVLGHKANGPSCKEVDPLLSWSGGDGSRHFPGFSYGLCSRADLSLKIQAQHMQRGSCAATVF